MKIAIAIPTLNVAGGVKALLKYGAGLRNFGHDVIFYWQAYSAKNYLKHKIVPPRITWTEEPYTLTTVQRWSDMPYADVFIASSWRTAQPVWECIQKYKTHGIYFIQHHEALWDGGEEAAETYKLPLKKVVISNWLNQVMKENYGQDSTVLVTPVDDYLFHVNSDRPDRNKRVLMLHHTFDWKGVEDGIQAFLRAKQEIPDIRLVMLGGRERNPSLPDGTEYHYQPRREVLAQLYAGCGIFLCPSWYEGLGMPSMEAMATGAMLVTTDTGGSRDFALDRQTSLVVPARDITSLTRQLELAVLNWDQLASIRVNGVRYIRHWTWEKNIQTLMSILESFPAVH